MFPVQQLATSRVHAPRAGPPLKPASGCSGWNWPVTGCPGSLGMSLIGVGNASPKVRSDPVQFAAPDPSPILLDPPSSLTSEMALPPGETRVRFRSLSCGNVTRVPARVFHGRGRLPRSETIKAKSNRTGCAQSQRDRPAGALTDVIGVRSLYA